MVLNTQLLHLLQGFFFRVREAPQKCFLWRPKQRLLHLWCRLDHFGCTCEDMLCHGCLHSMISLLALLALFQIQPPPAFAVANSMQTETEFFFCRGKAPGHIPPCFVSLWWILWDQAMMPRTWDHQNWAFNNLLRFWSDGLKELEQWRSIWKLPDLNIHVFDTRRI